ncbi:MAG: substrate-binding domain-containing protein [Acidimicrobiia bacterium]
MCLNDRVALGAYQALADAGLPVPEAVSVISFDDSVLASWLQPGVTSIGIRHYEIGKWAVELLLSAQPPAIRWLPMPLRKRGSVASVA